MNTIQDLFQQAQLAEAAYADFSDPTKTTFDALTTGNSKFSAGQAATFLTQWEVVDQYIANGFIVGDNSGFSATLFRNKKMVNTPLRCAARLTQWQISCGLMLVWPLAALQSIN